MRTLNIIRDLNFGINRQFQNNRIFSNLLNIQTTNLTKWIFFGREANTILK
ncbi:hypothetical protein COAQ111491_06350 [Comamonas aquatilis]